MLARAGLAHIRQDAFVSGPLSRNLTGAVGGYYRRSKGIRDTGYTADRGGQVRGNLVYTSGGPCFVDFDDFLMGPPVQDLWLLGDGDTVRMTALCAGYEELRRLDQGALSLVEALRGLRMIHYAAWIGHRYHDPAFQRALASQLAEYDAHQPEGVAA